MDLRGKRAVVTGASSGIGRSVAVALARRGVALAIAARREPELASLAVECERLGVRCLVVPTDVSNASDCNRLIETATRELGGVDILVNDAGFAIFDSIAEAKPGDLRSMMDTNYFGTLHCTQAVLPQMLQRGDGTIVNVSSIVGLMGFARMGGYAATKFAIVGLTESLRAEVASRGVRVSMVCPATTRTEFFKTAEHGKMPGASRLILAVSRERVARTVLRAIERNSYRIIVPWTAAAYMKMKEIFPRTAHFLMMTVSALIERKSKS